MTLFFNAAELIGGDPVALVGNAGRLRTAQSDLQRLGSELNSLVTSSQSFWLGAGADAFRTAGQTTVAAADDGAAPLGQAAQAFEALGHDLQSAQDRAAAALDASTQLGLAPGDLLGRPWAVVALVAVSPNLGPSVARLLAEIVRAIRDGEEARSRFIRAMRSAASDLVTRALRDPDGRAGRRLTSDRVARREPGGDPNDDNSSFDSDWAGRAILERYLLGGGDWTIVDDESWTQYMMSNSALTEQLDKPISDVGKEALLRYLAGNRASGPFSKTFSAEIQNGEGIVGYEYLHGTDKDTGGFNIAGDTQVKPRSDGTYEVTVRSGYTWNDNIDPNPKYSTDRWKSGLAEVLTLGQADPYKMHITWHQDTTLILDRDGRVLQMIGYPHDVPRTP